MKRRAALVLGVVAVVLTACAGSSDRPADAGSLVTLEDYLTFATLNNAGLKAAFEQWKIAVGHVTQAKSLPDPRFTYGYFIEEVETRVGPQKHKLEIMQVLGRSA